jgi:hypothetical protein
VTRFLIDGEAIVGEKMAPAGTESVGASSAMEITKPKNITDCGPSALIKVKSSVSWAGGTARLG